MWYSFSIACIIGTLSLFSLPPIILITVSRMARVLRRVRPSLIRVELGLPVLRFSSNAMLTPKRLLAPRFLVTL